MTNSHFWTNTHAEIKKRLLAASPKARESDGKINQVKCPSCGKHEAYIYADQPNAVICHRMKECGAKTLTRDLYPDLFSDFQKRFKSSKDKPRATAEAFLQARGLDAGLFEFSQGGIPCGKRRYPTVHIEFDGVKFDRLIDYKGSDKARFTGKYKGKYFATKSVGKADRVFVVEGIIDALSLEQAGIPAIATLSSVHNPKSCFKEGIKYILAFDNDGAGIKAVYKFKSYLGDLKYGHEVALPPKGKDWNDLLIDGALSDDKRDETLEECGWRGRLALAPDAKSYFQDYYDKYPYSAIFEFRGQTFYGVYKEGSEKKPPEYVITRLLDCTLSISYSIEDASVEHESKLSHMISANSNREGVNTLRLNSADFSALNDFKSKLLQYRLLFFGSGQDLTRLAEYLFKKKPIKVRECQALGYDEKSGCYVFSGFLYDKDGKRFDVGKNGYFEDKKLKPFSGQDKSINRIEQINVGKFVADLHSAYGDKGLLALGFWISTSFSHVVFERFGFFPFMSFHGEPHCGKSDLTTLLNRCFFIDSEGLTMSSSNTRKGELRSISQKSSMVTALLEGRKDKTRFDYDSILPLYNRNSLQIRAQTTNDNRVHELKFDGTLAFVQNVEQFISKPAKERVVSIHFTADGLDNTYQAWQQLKRYSPEQLAGVGHFILTNRRYFEKKITPEIEEAADYFRSNGAAVDRIAKNHAVAYAGVATLIDLAKPEIKDDLLDFTLAAAIKKIETARSELHVADLFMEATKGLGTQQGVAESNGELIIHIATALNAMGTDFGSWDKKSLCDELKLTDCFIERKTSRAFGSGKECWFFKSQKHALPHYKSPEAAQAKGSGVIIL